MQLHCFFCDRSAHLNRIQAISERFWLFLSQRGKFHQRNLVLLAERGWSFLRCNPDWLNASGAAPSLPAFFGEASRIAVGSTREGVAGAGASAARAAAPDGGGVAGGEAFSGSGLENRQPIERSREKPQASFLGAPRARNCGSATSPRPGPPGARLSARGPASDGSPKPRHGTRTTLPRLF